MIMNFFFVLNTSSKEFLSTQFHITKGSKKLNWTEFKRNCWSHFHCTLSFKLRLQKIDTIRSTQKFFDFFFKLESTVIIYFPQISHLMLLEMWLKLELWGMGKRCINPACQEQRKRNERFTQGYCRSCWRRQNVCSEKISTICCGETEDRDGVDHVDCTKCGDTCHFECLELLGISRDTALDESWNCPKCHVLQVKFYSNSKTTRLTSS